MKRSAMFVVALMLAAAPAFGQTTAPERHGFTIMVNFGAGVQHDSSFQETAIGFGGANFGIGAFVTNKVAILGRLSGTSVTYDLSGQQVSGVLGGTVQYWLSDLFHVEAGGGMGYWNWKVLPESETESETGFGLILGAGVTVFERGHHNLQIGAEYAPVFTDLSTVHNFCVTFGYQFHK